MAAKITRYTHIPQKFQPKKKIEVKRKRTQKIYKVTLRLHITTEILVVLFTPLFNFASVHSEIEHSMINSWKRTTDILHVTWHPLHTT